MVISASRVAQGAGRESPEDQMRDQAIPVDPDLLLASRPLRSLRSERRLNLAEDLHGLPESVACQPRVEQLVVLRPAIGVRADPKPADLALGLHREVDDQVSYEFAARTGEVHQCAKPERGATRRVTGRPQGHR